jgi:hypothetical protein
MINNHMIKLVRSSCFNLYEATTQQFLKACISQNFISNPSLILGEKPRIICIDVENQTKLPIHYYFPLHKNFFMYFNKVTKIINRERLENFIDFLLRNDVYIYENNTQKGINIKNVKEHLSEIILDPGRVVVVYFLEDCFVELLTANYEEYIKHSFYNDNFDNFISTNKFRVPLFFNLVEKSSGINIVGFLDSNKLNDFRLIYSNKYKFVQENKVEYFRQIVLKHIGEIFTYCPYVYPKSRLQYQLLSQMYHIAPRQELMFYQYMFLLHSNNVNRKCLYPLNFDIFERIDINDLTKDEISLLSDYYMVPIKKLINNHLHFMPINEIGRSVLILEEDVMLHKYTTDPPMMFNCVDQYVYDDDEKE